MQIKSWQIVLLGIFVQILVFFIFLPHNANGGGLGALAYVFSLFLYFIYLNVGILLSVLLYIEKTRKLGAVSSILLGIGSLIFFAFNTGLDAIPKLGILPIFIIIAGTGYFWKIQIVSK